MAIPGQRALKLRKIMSSAGLDAVLLTSVNDIFYYTGREAMKDDLTLLLVPARGTSRLFPSPLSNEIKGGKHLIVRPLTGGWERFRKEISGYNKIGFDDRNTSFYLYSRMFSKGQEWRPFSSEMKSPRKVKDDGEVGQIMKAIAVAKKCFGIRLTGRRETDVASEIEATIRKHGAEPSFSPIVSSGSNSGFIHHIPGSSKLGTGLNIIDCGAMVGGYCSDLTRTLSFSRSAFSRKVLWDVESMQGELIDMISPGIKFSDVQKRYEELMKKGGYRLYHSFGHGVGLSVHEGPGGDDVLEPGMVLTVEPGVYEEKRGGCRIEDMIIVTRDGCRNLSG